MVWVDKMMKRLLIVALILALLGAPTIALASNISGAKYWAVIQISNNSTATTFVATTANISTTNLINGGYLNSSANNCVMRTSSGADVPFMPGYTPDGNPWCIWVPSIGDYGYQSDILYTANSTGGEIRYFPGLAGMTTPDNDATLELGDNFTIEQKGWVTTTFTDNYTDRNLVFKDAAFKTYISGTENITSIIYNASSNNTTLLPNASGNYTDIADQWPASTFHWDKVDDPVGADDDDTTVVRTANTVQEKDAYNLEDGTISSTSIINSANVTFTFAANNANGTAYCQPFLRLNGSETAGTERNVAGTAFTTFSETLARPGGGSWLPSDIPDLQVAIGLRINNASYKAQCTQVYIFVDYTAPATTVTATGVSSGEYTVKTTQGSDALSWWDTDWGARTKLTFDNSASSENLTDFPVLVHLTTSNFDFNLAQANGEDIRFVDSDNTTSLDFEIENWASTEAWIWVEVPQIDLGSTTDFIHMYYGNKSVADGQDVTGTWNSAFVMVQHLSDNSTSTTLDSTSNDNDGVKKGVNEPVETTGQIYKAQDSDAIDDVITVDDVASLSTLGPLTLEAWIKASVASGSIIRKDTGVNGGREWLFRDVNKLDCNLWSVASANNLEARGTNDATDGDWHFVAVTWDGVNALGHLELFLDAVEEVLTIENKAGTGYVPHDSATDVLLGQKFGGDFDEVRISNIARSVDWLEATYLSGLDTFVTYSSEELNGLRIYLDGALKDIGSAASVPDNGNNWAFIENDSMPYMEYQKIWIGGNLRQHIVWEYDDEFTDLSGNSNPATPSFRSASSDPHVSAELISFQPVSEAKAPDYVLGKGVPFIDPGITGNVTGTFTTTPGTGTFPLATVITAIAEATKTPPQLPLLIIAVFVILAASLSVSATMRRYGSGSLLVKTLVIASVMGIFVALGNFAIDFWMVVVFLVIAISLCFASKQLGWS